MVGPLRRTLSRGPFATLHVRGSSGRVARDRPRCCRLHRFVASIHEVGVDGSAFRGHVAGRGRPASHRMYRGPRPTPRGRKYLKRLAFRMLVRTRPPRGRGPSHPLSEDSAATVAATMPQGQLSTSGPPARQPYGGKGGLRRYGFSDTSGCERMSRCRRPGTAPLGAAKRLAGRGLPRQRRPSAAGHRLLCRTARTARPGVAPGAIGQ